LPAECEQELSRHKAQVKRDYLVGGNPPARFERYFAKVLHEVEVILSQNSEQKYRNLSLFFVRVPEELRPFYATVVRYAELKSTLCNPAQPAKPLTFELTNSPVLHPLQQHLLEVRTQFTAKGEAVQKLFYFALNAQTKAWLLAMDESSWQTCPLGNLTFYHGNEWAL
jgi:hypothetical protein